MTELQQLLEWTGMGLVGMIALAVVLMLIHLYKDDDNHRD